MICNSEKNYMISGLNALRGAVIVGNGVSDDDFPYLNIETLKHKHVFKIEASCDGEGNRGGVFIGLPEDPKGYVIKTVKYRGGFVEFGIEKNGDKQKVVVSQDDEMNGGGFLFGLPVVEEVSTKDKKRRMTLTNKIHKNEITADEIDNLFCETFCDNCAEKGSCKGCILLAATKAAHQSQFKRHKKMAKKEIK